MSPPVELALGTVQFGTAYGVAGRGEPVPEHEVRKILATAWQRGIRVLDTAPVYGDIEQRLSALAADFGFSIVSKIPGLPVDATRDTAVRHVEHSLSQSRLRLGARLTTVLFHREEDLLGPLGETAWAAAGDAAGPGIRLGVSCYSPDAAARIARRFQIAALQLPGNILDQRLVEDRFAMLGQTEVHVRSAFLQGLLLLPIERAVARVPKSATALRRFAAWCVERDLDPLRAALGAVKALPGVRYCVVGTDDCTQLEQIVSAWQSATPEDIGSLACSDEDVIDPRRWLTK